MEKYRPGSFVIAFILLALLAHSCLFVTSIFPLPSPECHEDERSALLMLKQDFRYSGGILFELPDDYTSTEPWNIDSWKLEGGSGNCCAWDGVECDVESGRVVGLELCCTGLGIAINSSSSLFRLVHLRKVNLAYNGLSLDSLPSALDNLLPNLTSLNFSNSKLTGDIPPEILSLSNLSSLDLSWNDGLELTRPSLGDLLRSLTKLEELNLSGVSISLSSLLHFPTNFSSLRSLVLSNCGLEGQVPSSIFSGRLSSLDLSNNMYLELKKPSLGDLLRTMTKLEELDLSNVNIHSSLVDVPKNLSHLRSLVLSECGIHGGIPSSIFSLPNLQVLDLSNNDLFGPVPEFPSNSLLKSLYLRMNNFSGKIPASISNVSSLQFLDFRDNFLSGLIPDFPSHSLLRLLNLNGNNLSGGIPASIFHLSSLQVLDLSNNDISGRIQASVSNISSLQVLHLSHNSFSGRLPAFPSNSRLESLLLNGNNFSGEIPASMGDLTGLRDLDLSRNRLKGPIPSFADRNRLQRLCLYENQLTGSLSPSLRNLFQVQYMDLHANHLIDEIPSQHLNLSQLHYLDLSFNMLSESVISSILNSTDLDTLRLASCNLRSFPRILHKLPKLFDLDLSLNDIPGEVPIWFQEFSRESLEFLNLSYNSLTGFEGNTTILRWTKLLTLDLRSNQLRGPLPLPPESIRIYRATNNAVSGEISPAFCRRIYIDVLDLGNNNLTGMIPRCFTNLTSLSMLSLSRNNLHGAIPAFTSNGCLLEMLDMSGNQLEGPLPRTLSGCNQLKYLNLGDNVIEDTFPSWLGAITPLSILILRSNKFHGSILKSKNDLDFPRLHIIDLSQNNFEGLLPAEYFQRWTSMRASDTKTGMYFGRMVPTNQSAEPTLYSYTMSIMNKGMEMEYPKILNDFQMIDFSSNNLSGDIPSSIAGLTGLCLLNLSNNLLSGPIPQTLRDLKNMEALDFSKNRLSGNIPEQLTKLTFLAFFDVSGNNLSGHIPKGKQFDSFKNTSYEGNQGLCGEPLSRTCGGPIADPPPSHAKEMEMDESFIIEWKAVAVGYVAAFFIAAVVGHKIIIVEPTPYIGTVGLIQWIRWWSSESALPLKLSTGKQARCFVIAIYIEE